MEEFVVFAGASLPQLRFKRSAKKFQYNLGIEIIGDYSASDRDVIKRAYNYATETTRNGTTLLHLNVAKYKEANGMTGPGQKWMFTREVVMIVACVSLAVVSGQRFLQYVTA